jgi:hypothetical protein
MIHLSMTQSVPSSTALATSVASARVGRGFFTMLSSICVAVMTGLPTCMCQMHASSLCSSADCRAAAQMNTARGHRRASCPRQRSVMRQSGVRDDTCGNSTSG